MAASKKKPKKKKNKEKLMAGLVEITPGVMVNTNYKRGKDKALDAVLDKLKKNPSGLDSSGFGNRMKI
tara:strand:+ start:1647 stop:1850 length:204 start_codon:yes stop_codon:yes gene_type:complete